VCEWDTHNPHTDPPSSSPMVGAIVGYQRDMVQKRIITRNVHDCLLRLLPTLA